MALPFEDRKDVLHRDGIISLPTAIEFIVCRHGAVLRHNVLIKDLCHRIILQEMAQSLDEFLKKWDRLHHRL